MVNNEFNAWNYMLNENPFIFTLIFGSVCFNLLTFSIITKSVVVVLPLLISAFLFTFFGIGCVMKEVKQ